MRAVRLETDPAEPAPVNVTPGRRREIAISRLRGYLLDMKRDFEITSDGHRRQELRDAIAKLEKILANPPAEPEPVNVKQPPMENSRRNLLMIFMHTKQVLESTNHEADRQQLLGIIAKIEKYLAVLDTGKDRERHNIVTRPPLRPEQWEVLICNLEKRLLHAKQVLERTDYEPHRQLFREGIAQIDKELAEALERTKEKLKGEE